MKLFATKNDNKKEDKHPDFRVFIRDNEGDIIEESYETQNGEVKRRWMEVGAIWHKVENGKIKNSTIILNDDKVEMKIKFKAPPEPTEETTETSTEEANSDKIPF